MVSRASSEPSIAADQISSFQLNAIRLPSGETVGWFTSWIGRPTGCAWIGELKYMIVKTVATTKRSRMVIKVLSGGSFYQPAR